MKVRRKSHGMYEKEWIKCVEECYNERQTLFPIDPKQLKRLYDQDYSIEEVLLKDLTKGHLYAFMELHVKHQLGEYRTTFRSENEAKEFFRKFPEIRQELLL